MDWRARNLIATEGDQQNVCARLILLLNFRNRRAQGEQAQAHTHNVFKIISH